jgi:diguanylate cyclase (GGDEF) domain
MSLIKFADINKFLNEKKVFESVFDLVRVVDPTTGTLFNYEGGRIARGTTSCLEFLGNEERCANCSSLRAYMTGEQVEKFEHANGEIFWVISLPIVHEGKTIVVELIRNVSRHAPSDGEGHGAEFRNVINALNASATIDPVSGLKDRAFLKTHLENVTRKYNALGAPLCIALIGFDAVSLYGKYGQSCADLLVTSAGGVIHSYIRSESDIAVRYDEERFLICFAGVGVDGAYEVCARIRDHIEGTPVNYKGMPVHETVSVGIVSITEDRSAPDLVALAAIRLDEARKRGKSSIVHY